MTSSSPFDQLLPFGPASPIWQAPPLKGLAQILSYSLLTHTHTHTHTCMHEHITHSHTHTLTHTHTHAHTHTHTHACMNTSHTHTRTHTLTQWFNLDSLLRKPKLVSDTYLSLFLTQLQMEGTAALFFIPHSYYFKHVFGCIQNLISHRCPTSTGLIQTLPNNACIVQKFTLEESFCLPISLTLLDVTYMCINGGKL